MGKADIQSLKKPNPKLWWRLNSHNSIYCTPFYCTHDYCSWALLSINQLNTSVSAQYQEFNSLLWGICNIMEPRKVTKFPCHISIYIPCPGVDHPSAVYFELREQGLGKNASSSYHHSHSFPSGSVFCSQFLLHYNAFSAATWFCFLFSL